eukprot:TRINITY_DN4345_c0_g2_i1.p1 TRINITY_DN4345_c0_g2~~TRINITY_DN4345_c0_g2_i1.p1  ORF type:complete len:399 (+),score=78.73 TRINITY_DN4345_c0_g2_i1:50-1246(+)
MLGPEHLSTWAAEPPPRHLAAPSASMRSCGSSAYVLESSCKSYGKDCKSSRDRYAKVFGCSLSIFGLTAFVGRASLHQKRHVSLRLQRLAAGSTEGKSPSTEESVAAPANLYEVFGFTTGAQFSAEELQSRRRALLKACHPDVAGPGGAALTVLVAEAAEILSETASRAAYDKTLLQTIRGVGAVSRNQTDAWPALRKVKFSKGDSWDLVAEEDRGEHHQSDDRLFVDEVACTGCQLCTELAPETFEMVELPHGDTRGGGSAARVMQQWGDAEFDLQNCVECCPGGCIYWVPKDCVRTLEYVAQAPEYFPDTGSKRTGRPKNFDPWSGSQIYSPLDTGMDLYRRGKICPSSSSNNPDAAGTIFLESASQTPYDARVLAAWAELSDESKLQARAAVREE